MEDINGRNLWSMLQDCCPRGDQQLVRQLLDMSRQLRTIQKLCRRWNILFMCLQPVTLARVTHMSGVRQVNQAVGASS